VNHKALVIEDDPEAIEQIEDVLAALGHEYELARNLIDARKLLQDGKFSYSLLDWDIPARGWQSRPRVQNSVNFLDEIRQAPHMDGLPVIVMVDRAPEDVEIMVDMMRLAAELAERGHVDFISKPFPTAGRTLDRVIRKNIGNGAAVSPVKRIDVATEGSPSRQKEDSGRRSREKKASSSHQAIANEAVTLDDFMAKFCEKISARSIVHRRKALLAAGRHGTVTMAPLAEPYRRGKRKKYFTHDLLAAWPDFHEKGVELPTLKPEFRDAE